jgi:hypothetical protein
VKTRIFYHTQASRDIQLLEPVICTRDDAWLGDAIYFWLDIIDADEWGVNAKKETGFYEVYVCDINFEQILDTVFNEEHYNFWFSQIEKIANLIISKTNIKPTIKELNDYLKKDNVWDELDGIMFQDLPINPDKLLIKPFEKRNGPFKKYFYYRKRIQLAVYNSNIISNFTLLKKEKHN